MKYTKRVDFFLTDCEKIIIHDMKRHIHNIDLSYSMCMEISITHSSKVVEVEVGIFK